MVLKTEKHGVRTGNTPKRCCPCFLHQYRTSSCITRQFVPNEAQLDEKITDDLGVATALNDGVVYSLNKKKRWLLPDKIRSQITDDDHEDNDTDMRITEYHRIRGKTANCVRFTSLTTEDPETGERQTKTKRKRRGYFDVSSVMDKNKPNRSRNRNRRNGNNNSDDDDEAERPVPTQLNYQVVYPSPATSYTSRHHKYIDYYTNDHYRYWYRNSRDPDRQRVKTSELVHEFQADTDYYSMNYDDVYDIEEPEKHSMKNIVIDFKDIIDQRNKNKLRNDERVKNKRKNKNEVDTETDEHKGHVIYIEPEAKLSNSLGEESLLIGDNSAFDLKDFTPTSELEEGKRKYTIVEPAPVNLCTAETTQSRLREKFGQRYMECNCYPRKFVIDISEKIERFTEKDNGHLTYACLTFVKEKEGGTKTTTRYLLYFNMRFDAKIDYVNLFALYHYTVTTTTIDKVIQKAVSYVCICDGAIIKDKKTHTRNVKQHPKTTLEHCANWGSFAYLPNLKDLYNCFVQTSEDHALAKDLGFKMVSSTELHQVNEEIAKEGYCAICFNDIADPVPATALYACGHWFCDCCWKEHLITCVREGRLDFICPEYECDKRVDRGTMLSLLDLNHVLLYLRRRHDIDVELMNVAKWCPNSSCGRVVKVNSEGVIVASCTCGKKACFVCQTDVHWPAECSVAHNYRRKLRENGDDKISPVVTTEPFTVNGRNCPFCKRFVEKNGGCPFMTCICKHNFCWGCGKQWNLTKHGVECYKSGTLNNHKGTQDITVKEEMSNLARSKLISRWYKNANWYKLAVEHRTRRKLITQHKLLDSVRKLGPNLAHHVSKAQRNNTPVSFDFVMPNKAFSCEAAKAGDFLKDTMALFSEIHEIIEHVAIYLDSTPVEKSDVISIQNTVNRMAILSGTIYDMLMNGHTLDEKYVFNNLKETRHRSKKCIKGLVKYFNVV